ncbi:unnamed protein product [Peronospora belbahrii]|uniref:Uncharacterized protein n=1 Tax=Peronospora belbahrii TaxID=622444 RepID=A0AAU9LGA1_9STRA|nr:unnamed protein product [Peronospora belbahrii]
MYYLDFNSMERCLALDLGSTRNAPGGALESHEPTSARKQKRFWRGYWTKSANMLDVELSESVDTVSIADSSHGRGLWAESSVVEKTLDDTHDMF